MKSERNMQVTVTVFIATSPAVHRIKFKLSTELFKRILQWYQRSLKGLETSK